MNDNNHQKSRLLQLIVSWSQWTTTVFLVMCFISLPCFAEEFVFRFEEDSGRTFHIPDQYEYSDKVPYKHLFKEIEKAGRIREIKCEGEYPTYSEEKAALEYDLRVIDLCLRFNHNQKNHSSAITALIILDKSLSRNWLNPRLERSQAVVRDIARACIARFPDTWQSYYFQARIAQERPFTDEQALLDFVDRLETNLPSLDWWNQLPEEQKNEYFAVLNFRYPSERERDKNPTVMHVRNLMIYEIVSTLETASSGYSLASMDNNQIVGYPKSMEFFFNKATEKCNQFLRRDDIEPQMKEILKGQLKLSQSYYRKSYKEQYQFDLHRKQNNTLTLRDGSDRFHMRFEYEEANEFHLPVEYIFSTTAATEFLKLLERIEVLKAENHKRCQRDGFPDRFKHQPFNHKCAVDIIRLCMNFYLKYPQSSSALSVLVIIHDALDQSNIWFRSCIETCRNAAIRSVKIFPDCWQSKMFQITILRDIPFKDEKEAMDYLYRIESLIPDRSIWKQLPAAQQKEYFALLKYLHPAWDKHPWFPFMNVRNLLIKELIDVSSSIPSGASLIEVDGNSMKRFPENPDTWYQKSENYCAEFDDDSLVEPLMSNLLRKFRREFLPEYRISDKKYFESCLEDSKRRATY